MLLPSDDDHQGHIAIHQDVALDDTQPWSVRMLTLLHIAEHRTMLAQQQAKPPREPAVSVQVKAAELDPEQTRAVLAADGINVPPLDPVAAKVGAAAREPPAEGPASSGKDTQDANAKPAASPAPPAPSGPHPDVQALVEELRKDREERRAAPAAPAEKTVHVHLTKGT